MTSPLKRTEGAAPNPSGAVQHERFVTAGGITVVRTSEDIALPGAIEPLIDALDSRRGVLLASSFEFPGRYTRWDMGFVDPPVELVCTGRNFKLSALNPRGEILLSALSPVVQNCEAVAESKCSKSELVGRLIEPKGPASEEERSRQPSIFTLLRGIVSLFAHAGEPHLGLYGAFGYDLAFQFEPIRLKLPRLPEQRDLVLYLPDELVIVDHSADRATRLKYEFETPAGSTEKLPRTGGTLSFKGAAIVQRAGDHAPGEYVEIVKKAKESFACGDLFEVVPGQTFFEPCPAPPSEVFRRLRQRNPAPYGFLINLGEREYLVGASPEMFVRVDGARVQTCPISGTIARGADSISDAAQIRELLNSKKDEAELTMCTDVDRNDKSRICKPGSVRVIGRRQIEMYSRLIHTVDHVEGYLREKYDALDAFLVHTWAVTVTGAPKVWAMQFIEDQERSPRHWYGGAIGRIAFDGNLNTGLTLRTIRIRDGVAQVRAGATLLFDSDAVSEELETRVKASALLDAIRRPRDAAAEARGEVATPKSSRRVVLVDHQDSFVHTLANYFRYNGAEVVTLRAGFDPKRLDELKPDLIVLSPGPGTPSDFNLSGTLTAAIARNLPVFGVCLGLQGMVEHFGGKLSVLPYPMHGKPSKILVKGGKIFEGLPAEFTAGRYHSLYGKREDIPACLRITAESDDGIVMAIEHTDKNIAAVQFHPESILTLEGDTGMKLVRNVMERMAK